MIQRSFVLGVLLAAISPGAILYDNFPLGTYRYNGTLPTLPSQSRLELYNNFTVTQTAVLTGFEGLLALVCCDQPALRSFTVTIYDGSSGVGAALDSNSVTMMLPPDVASTGLQPTYVGFSGGAVLTPGTYYVGIRNPGVDMQWFFSVLDNYTTRIHGDPVGAVPEPGTVGLMGSGLAVMVWVWGRARRRCHQG